MPRQPHEFDSYEDILHEEGLPGPEEISDEVRRTKEVKGPHRGKYLAVEDIPDWFSDTAEKKDEGEWQEIVGDFKKLVVSDQQEILSVMQEKMKANEFKTKGQMVKHIRRLVGDAREKYIIAESGTGSIPGRIGDKIIADAERQRRGRLKK